jgi:hypothetical protein
LSHQEVPLTWRFCNWAQANHPILTHGFNPTLDQAYNLKQQKTDKTLIELGSEKQGLFLFSVPKLKGSSALGDSPR